MGVGEMNEMERCYRASSSNNRCSACRHLPLALLCIVQFGGNLEKSNSRSDLEERNIVYSRIQYH